MAYLPAAAAAHRPELSSAPPCRRPKSQRPPDRPRRAGDCEAVSKAIPGIEADQAAAPPRPAPQRTYRAAPGRAAPSPAWLPWPIQRASSREPKTKIRQTKIENQKSANMLKGCRRAVPAFTYGPRRTRKEAQPYRHERVADLSPDVRRLFYRPSFRSSHGGRQSIRLGLRLPFSPRVETRPIASPLMSMIGDPDIPLLI